MSENKGPVYHRKHVMYTAYGLIIESEIPLPELTRVADYDSRQADVTIEYGTVPKSLSGVLNCNKYFQVSKNEFYFYVPKIAHYYVGFGKTIIVEPDENTAEHRIRLFLLGSCMGMLFIHRNILAIHGGAVQIGDQGVIITGKTGAGKSTLVSAFVKDGCKFLSDDVSVIDKDDLNSGVKVLPAYPQYKLCKDVMNNMGYKVELFEKIDNSREKYAVPLKKSFISHPIPLKFIFEIMIDNSGEDQIRVCELLGSEKVMALISNVYRKEFYDLIGLTPVCFKHCINIIKNIQMFRIFRPANAFSIERQQKIIIDLIKGSKTVGRCV